MTTITTGFTVTIDLARGPKNAARYEDLIAELGNHDAAVSYHDDGRWSVTLSITTANDLGGAIAAALHAFRRACDTVGITERQAAAIVAIEALTFAEHDRRLELPTMPALAGTAEIADLFGVSKQRASELRGRAGFPSPVAELASGPVYRVEDLSRFLDTWKRAPGRPAKATA